MWMVGAVSSLLASHASPMTFTPLPGLPFGAIVTGVLLGDLRYGDSSTSIVSKAAERVAPPPLAGFPGPRPAALGIPDQSHRAVRARL